MYLLQCVRYKVIVNTPATCEHAPCLVQDNVPLVDGVEDMQITYACDGCNQAAPNPGSGRNHRRSRWPLRLAAFPHFRKGLCLQRILGDFTRTPDKIRMAQVSLVGQTDRRTTALMKRTKAVSTTGPVIVGDHDPQQTQAMTRRPISTNASTGGDPCNPAKEPVMRDVEMNVPQASKTRDMKDEIRMTGQQGIALLTVMLMLLILSILGIASITVTSMETGWPGFFRTTSRRGGSRFL